MMAIIFLPLEIHIKFFYNSNLDLRIREAAPGLLTINRDYSSEIAHFSLILRMINLLNIKLL